MAMKQTLALVLGLSIAMGGCVFSPDLGGSGPACKVDSDCSLEGHCSCLGGVCIQSLPGQICDGTVTCERACDPGETCVDGLCLCGGVGGQTCSAMQICCSGECVLEDEYHCGQCNIDCLEAPAASCDGNDLLTYVQPGLCKNHLCEHGQSSLTCTYGCFQAECLSDPCDGTCLPGEICLGGACSCGGGPSCHGGQDCLNGECICANEGRGCLDVSGETCCDGYCVDLLSDDANCGSCGTPCNQPPPNYCDDGQTLVAYDLTGTCTEWGCEYYFNPRPCPGGCDQATGHCPSDPCQGVTCPLNTHCDGGDCHCGQEGDVCMQGEACCDSGCLNLGAGGEFCGACGLVCDSDLPGVNFAECINGNCKLVCESNTLDCDENPDNGCEVYPNYDTNNCGTCGKDCQHLAKVKVADCSMGGCLISECLGSYADCDWNPDNGCETDLDTAGSDCGFCLNFCPADQHCIAGDCIAMGAYDGVDCGNYGVCTGLELCCVTGVGHSCVLPPDGNMCAGLPVSCDGPRDCPNATACCLDPDGYRISCTDDCSRGQIVCIDDGDCQAGESCVLQFVLSLPMHLCVANQD